MGNRMENEQTWRKRTGYISLYLMALLQEFPQEPEFPRHDALPQGEAGSLTPAPAKTLRLGILQEIPKEREREREREPSRRESKIRHFTMAHSMKCGPRTFSPKHTLGTVFEKRSFWDTWPFIILRDIFKTATKLRFGGSAGLRRQPERAGYDRPTRRVQGPREHRQSPSFFLGD